MKLEIYERGVVYTIGLLGGVIGPVLLGKYSDRFGHLEVATLSACLAVSLVYLLSVYDSPNQFLTLHLFLIGFASFALPTLLQSHLVKITQEYRRDLAVGMFFTTNFAFGSLWAGVMGYIVDLYSSFKPAFILMGTLGLVALAILIDQVRKESSARNDQTSGME